MERLHAHFIYPALFPLRLMTKFGSAKIYIDEIKSTSRICIYAWDIVPLFFDVKDPRVSDSKEECN